jgi:alkylhydroperoxidase/carboxymuconolactone decarboxylase family protein YurZ
MNTAGDPSLARFSVAIVLGLWDELRALRLSAPPGEPDRRWREALLQAHLFAGFPRVVEASEVLAQVGGLGRPDADEARAVADRFAEGRALFDRIYAENAPEVRGALESYHPVLARWIEGHAYGRVLARDGLAPQVREILAVACLVALGQERQLASHVRGALRLGADERELHAALDAIAELVPPETLERGRRVLERFSRAELGE